MKLSKHHSKTKPNFVTMASVTGSTAAVSGDASAVAVAVVEAVPVADTSVTQQQQKQQAPVQRRKLVRDLPSSASSTTSAAAASAPSAATSTTVTASDPPAARTTISLSHVKAKTARKQSPPAIDAGQWWQPGGSLTAVGRIGSAAPANASFMDDLLLELMDEAGPAGASAAVDDEGDGDGDGGDDDDADDDDDEEPDPAAVRYAA